MSKFYVVPDIGTLVSLFRFSGPSSVRSKLSPLTNLDSGGTLTTSNE